MGFHQLIRIWYRKIVRQWQFEGSGPHYRHEMHLHALPEGRCSLYVTATRGQRVWLFPEQAAAEEAAGRMRAAL
jgi:hypothetical protein